jgi:hypothetical protein
MRRGVSLQGEALWTFVDSGDADDSGFFGFYAQACADPTGSPNPGG